MNFVLALGQADAGQAETRLVLIQVQDILGKPLTYDGQGGQQG
jgi:hypothetical protein